MLKFLFGGKGKPAVEVSQRETINKLVEDLNAALIVLPEKPVMTLDLNTGGIALQLPDQLPDEALALPAPSEEELLEQAA